MTQTSVGFNGSIQDLQWAKYAPLLASGERCLLNVGDLLIGQVASTRSVTVGAGTIAANGVATTLDATETMVVPIPTNGQWHLLVLNRIWGTNSTSLQLRPGPTTSNAVPTALPAAYPASFANNPGVNSDAPIAWLHVKASDTNVLWAPLTFPHTGLNPRRGALSARNPWYQNAAGGLTGLWLPNMNAEWFNTDSEWVERVFGARASAGSADPGRPLSWYPTHGHLPHFELDGQTTAATGSFANNAFLDLPAGSGWPASTRSVWGGPSYLGSGLWSLGQAGKWLMTAQVSYPAAQASKRILRLVASSGGVLSAFGNGEGGSGTAQLSGEVHAATAGEQVKLQFFQNSGSTMSGATLDYFRGVYLGPL